MDLAMELTGSLTNDESKSLTVCFSQLPIPLLDLDFFLSDESRCCCVCVFALTLKGLGQ